MFVTIKERISNGHVFEKDGLFWGKVKQYPTPIYTWQEHLKRAYVFLRVSKINKKMPQFSEEIHKGRPRKIRIIQSFQLDNEENIDETKQDS